MTATYWDQSYPPSIYGPSPGAAGAGDDFTGEEFADVTASDATNAAKLAGLGFVASPTTAWVDAWAITVNGHAFHWDGDTWAAGAAPAPTITALEPDQAFLGSEDFEGHVRGTGFTEETVIWWNDAPEPTRFVDDTDVWTLVKPSAVTSPTTVEVTVRTPSGYMPDTLTFSWAQGEGFAQVEGEAAPEPEPTAKRTRSRG